MTSLGGISRVDLAQLYPDSIPVYTGSYAGPLGRWLGAQSDLAAMPGDLHEADRAPGLVDLADDLRTRVRSRAGPAKARDIDHGSGENAVAQGGRDTGAFPC
jgi:hypothetical protein